MFTPFKRVVVVSILTTFLGSTIHLPQAQAQGIPWMPVPGVRVGLSVPYKPAFLKGMVVHQEDALRFDFLIHQGDEPLPESQKKDEYEKLIKYFMASLTVPDDNQWVNLSPYEKNRIIEKDFSQTEMGRDLLAQDYLLKQITASLVYPEENLGKKFWDRVFTRAQQELGTTNIPMNTFNKVWIVPDRATVYEKNDTVYVLENHLKVMMEEDYLALEKNSVKSSLAATLNAQERVNQPSSVSSKVVREIIIPELEREVNEGKNFAPLRQIYSGMILAAWYKRALKESLLGKVYANRAKVNGVNIDDPKDNEKIYQQYLTAYKKGVFNFIKEDVDKLSNQPIPRKYFSGGALNEYGKVLKFNNDPAMARTDFAQAAPAIVAVETAINPGDQAMSARQQTVATDVANKVEAPKALEVKTALRFAQVIAASLENNRLDKSVDGINGLGTSLDTEIYNLRKSSRLVIDPLIDIEAVKGLLKVVPTTDGVAKKVVLANAQPLTDDSNYQGLVAQLAQFIAQDRAANRYTLALSTSAPKTDRQKALLRLISDNSPIMSNGKNYPYFMVKGAADRLDLKYDFTLQGWQIVDAAMTAQDNLMGELLGRTFTLLSGDQVRLINLLNTREKVSRTVNLIEVNNEPINSSPYDVKPVDFFVNIKNVGRDQLSLEIVDKQVRDFKGLIVRNLRDLLDGSNLTPQSKARIRNIISDKTDDELMRMIRVRPTGNKFVTKASIEEGNKQYQFETEIYQINLDAVDASMLTAQDNLMGELLGKEFVLSGGDQVRLINLLNTQQDRVLRTVNLIEVNNQPISRSSSYDLKPVDFFVNTENVGKDQFSLKTVAQQVRNFKSKIVRNLRDQLTSNNLTPQSKARIRNFISEKTDEELMRTIRVEPTGNKFLMNAAIDEANKAYQFKAEIYRVSLDMAMAVEQQQALKVFLDQHFKLLEIPVKENAAIINEVTQQQLIGDELKRLNVSLPEGIEIEDLIAQLRFQKAVGDMSGEPVIRITPLVTDKDVELLANAQLPPTPDDDFDSVDTVLQGRLKDSLVEPLLVRIALGQLRYYLREGMKGNPQLTMNELLSNPKKVETILREVRYWYQQALVRNTDMVKSKVDTAMSSKVVEDKVGGIDLNAANLNMLIKRDGNGVPLPFSQQDPAMLNKIDGMVPVIINIKPMMNLPILSELRNSGSDPRSLVAGSLPSAS